MEYTRQNALERLLEIGAEASTANDNTLAAIIYTILGGLGTEQGAHDLRAVLSDFAVRDKYRLEQEISTHPASKTRQN